MYTLSQKRYSLIVVASFSRVMCRATKQKQFRNGLRSTTMSLRIVLASRFTRSQSSRVSVGCAGQTTKSLIHWGPTSLLTGLKGSSANISLPITTAHLHGSSGVLAGAGLLWQQKVDQHNIWQVVIMLCLLGVWCMYICTSPADKVIACNSTLQISGDLQSVFKVS